MFSINDLNKTQLEIAKDTEGAILVTAGAGSGKTRLLTHRICYIIEEKHVNPENIIAITFTNKATNEMRERIEKMLPSAKDVWVSTFHAMCVRILRSAINHLDGYTKYFTIYDESDKDKLLKQILKGLEINVGEFKSKIEWHISNAKNMGLTPEEYAENIKYDPNKDEIFKVYKEYETKLKENNALDFDDLLAKTLYLFEHCPDVLEYYQRKFQYILVDEFQDTNVVQYKLVKMLASYHKNIFVVGDEDQCIYCWRGANIENIKNFIKDFGAKVYKLEQNYRSSKNIIASANELIKNNKERIEKTLFTENEDGDKIEYYKAYDEQEEAEYVAKTISNLIDNGVNPNEIGVLMRISSLSRLFEEKLLNYNIPYKVSGIFKFFERAEIKNILAYLSVIVNHKDNISFLRIINVPKRGIGDASIDKMAQYAIMHNISLFDLVANIRVEDLPSALKSKLLAFSELLNELDEMVEKSTLTEFVKTLIDATHIKDMYSEDTEENEDRKRNIDQMLQSVTTFDNLNENATVSSYLESVTLQNSIDEDDSEAKVSVSTVHASKGLEFDYVFIVGAEENVFPLARCGEIEDIEEERRLMYVAITRARKKVIITKAKTRFLYGCRESTLESRFLKEAKISNGETKEKFISDTWGYSKYYAKYANAGLGNGGHGYNSRRQEEHYGFDNNFSKKSEEKFEATKPSALAFMEKKIKTNDKFKDYIEGAKVKHPKFGVGVIIKKENIGDITFVKIDFGGFGVKNLSLAFAPLELIK